MESYWIQIYVSYSINTLQKKNLPKGSVHDNHLLKGGHTTHFWCSQDERQKKASKKSDNPNAKHCDTVGMKHYPCKSAMMVTYKQNKIGGQNIFVWLQHHVSHVLYSDIQMPPEVLQTIQEQAEWSTPSAMAAKIQSAYPQVKVGCMHDSPTSHFRDPCQKYQNSHSPMSEITPPIN